jgi:hypothetical protein
MKAIKGLLISMALVLVVLAAVFVLPPRWREHQLMRQSESIVAALEGYREHHGHYPESLEKVGITSGLEGPIYYQLESESSYELWFGTSFGESRTFSSTERLWR